MPLLCPPLSAITNLNHHITLPPDPDNAVPSSHILGTYHQEVVATSPCLDFSQQMFSFHVPKLAGIHLKCMISQKSLQHDQSPSQVKWRDREEELKRSDALFKNVLMVSLWLLWWL